MNLLDKVKLLLNITDASQDSLLNQLIEGAKGYTIDYCNFINYDVKLDNIVIQMAIEDYNRLGSDGIISKSFSGISESYLDDYSPKVIKALNKNRRIKFM